MKQYLLALLINSLFAFSVFANGVTTDTLTKDTVKAKSNDTLKFTPNKPIEVISYYIPSEESSVAMRSSMSSLSSGTDAGRTPGSLDVSISGAATYNVPIAVAPGINGVMPQIALTYSSQGGNGVAGYGWAISGLSAITRIPRTLFHDGFVGGVNGNLDDRFALNGQRLLLKSGTYGADGAEYQTENYSNLRIVSRSSIGVGLGPAYFDVYYPDGSHAVFGQNSDSFTKNTYAINYIDNPINARISYSYIKSNETLVISHIDYGALSSGTPMNQISFVYTARSRNEQSFIGGTALYKTSLLSQINVKGNGGTGYRNYILTYETAPGLNYDRLSSLQELSVNGSKSLDPIEFGYNTTNEIVTVNGYSSGLSNAKKSNTRVITGDFTGNGKMDLLVYPASKDNLYLLLDPSGGSLYTQPVINQTVDLFEDVFAVSTLDDNNRLFSGQGFTTVHQPNSTTIKFRTYLPSTYGSSSVAPFEKTWNPVPRMPIYLSNCTPEVIPSNQIPRAFFSGDFNGDGLTDIITVSRPYNQPTSTTVDGNGGCTLNTTPIEISTVHFIDLDRRITSNFVNQAGTLSLAYSGTDQIFTGDANGDGKTDLIHVSNGLIYVYTLDSSNNLVLLWTTSDSSSIVTGLFELSLVGDFNGDGKTDIMFPSANGSSSFALFVSKGNSFEKHMLSLSFSYNATSYSGNNITSYNLAANDVNGDGKTDIVRSVTTTTVGGTTGNATITVYNNVATSSVGEPSFILGATTTQTNIDLGSEPIPLYFPNTESNYGSEYGLYGGSTMTLLTHQKDNRKDNRIATVLQNGIYTTINYDKLATGTITGVLPLYQKRDAAGYTAQSYPYFDIDQQPGFTVVSQLTRSYNNNSLSQYFSYNGAVSHANGLGFLGFHETVKSNWITSTTDNNRKYNTTVYDPQLRGAVIRSFLSTDPFANNSTIKNKTGTPLDILMHDAVTGTQTVVAANSITLKDGFSANGTNGVFIAKLDEPLNGISDGGTTVGDYITRTDYTYDNRTLTSKVFINNPMGVVTKDLLNKTNTVLTYSYDSYFNVTDQTNNYSGAGTNTTHTTYANSPGSYYGRITQINETSNIGGDSFSTEVQYGYTGFLPTQIKRKGNGTPFITENYVYDIYGNPTTKTISTLNDGSRAVTMIYDGTGRFNTSITDVNSGLTNSMAYDAVTGTLTSKTNPYSQTTGYTYDVWNRPLVTTDYLGHTSSRSYSRSGSDMIIADIDQEGRANAATINALGQTTLTTVKDVLGQTVGKQFGYDVYGRQITESEPGISSYNQLNITEYDAYDRVKKLSAYTGRITTISYDGLETTVNDGTKTTKSVRNALGNVLSIQDPGGSINNTYFANGDLKSADYGGSKQTIEQDGWGRKTKLTDPSAGTYSYGYNQFGELLNETTPKGTTTYTYNTDGSVNTKQITGIGNGTNMGYTYSYNGDKTIHIVGLTNGDGNDITYTYGYDTYKRVNSVTENNHYAIFTKTLSYDVYGNIATETNQAQNKRNGLIASKSITNNYQYGQVKSIADAGTSQTIWEVGALNARGQVTTALLGSSLKQTNTFDTYGYPSELKTEKINVSPFAEIMKLTYTFDAQRGNVSNRGNTAFSPAISETFAYDNQDRLTGFNDGTSRTQQYDGRGRITNNSRLGDYSYDGNSYQQSGLTNLSAFAKFYYQSRTQQQISYNAFKAPIAINEEGIEKIDFQYNGGLGRSHMYYGNTNADKTLRPYRRHYSEDGSMEITEDIANTETSFIFYLGGDAYTAPAVWKKKQVGSTVTINGLYYLQRDHLGSIAMITDGSGNIEEKRQFDAWGNIIQVTNGAGATLSGLTFIDRGYTGHEHLQGVGLINMNTRLYDPLLHRFLAPDNIIQDPYNTQDYNRYAYVLNNPLKYTDPTGNARPNLEENNGSSGSNAFNSFLNANFSGPLPGFSSNYDTWSTTAWMSNPNYGQTIGFKGYTDSKGRYHGLTFYDADRFLEIAVPSIGNDPNNTINSNAGSQGGAVKQEGPYKTVHSSWEAVKHYYTGDGQPVQLGRETVEAVLNNKKFKAVYNNIKSGNVNTTNGRFNLNLTKSIFHVGRTNVTWSISNVGKKYSVVFNLFVGDGFWDPDFIDERYPISPHSVPDGKGPNLERSGTPYDYIPSVVTFKFKRP
jgi:RHS repeat-associated protein